MLGDGQGQWNLDHHYSYTFYLLRVNPGLLFEQIMKGLSPQCYILTFMEIGPLISGKRILKGFLPYIEIAAILVSFPCN